MDNYILHIVYDNHSVTITKTLFFLAIFMAQYHTLIMYHNFFM